MWKPFFVAGVLCAALLSAAGVVAQTDASVAVTPGRAPTFTQPDPRDARTVITPGPAETVVNPELRGRRGPLRSRTAPRLIVPGENTSGTSVHPGSRPVVIYPEGDPRTTVRPGRRPVVVYPP